MPQRWNGELLGRRHRTGKSIDHHHCHRKSSKLGFVDHAPGAASCVDEVAGVFVVDIIARVILSNGLSMLFLPMRLCRCFS